MELKHTSSPVKKKFKVVPSTGKVLVTVFWDAQGVLLVDLMELGATINAAVYCATLERLRKAIKKKWPGLLTQGIILLYDNARPLQKQDSGFYCSGINNLIRRWDKYLNSH